MVFEVGIGTSQCWNPEIAAEEATKNALKSLSMAPTFVMLFSTIHHKKNNGFNRILEAIYKIIPEKTAVVGGTVPGFATNAGVFTMGLCAFAVFSDEIDIIAIKEAGTKKNPRRAAENIISKLKKWENGVRVNKVLIDFISGPTVPQFSILKRKKIIKNKIFGDLLASVANLSLELFQNGVGREEEILYTLSNNLPSYKIIGGSTLDNNELAANYQFFYKETVTNAIVLIAIATQKEVDIKTTYGLQKNPQKLSIEFFNKNKRIIKKINGKPATESFLETVKWPLGFLDERLYRKTFHYTIGFERENILYPEVIGAFYGSNIWVGYNLESKEASVLTASGKQIMKGIEEHITNFHEKKPHFGFIVACASILETFGRKTNSINDALKGYFGDSPFLTLYLGGEDTFSKEQGARHINYSVNSLVLH